MNAAALPPDAAAFVQGGVSITLASRDDRLVPSIGKGVGCRVADDGAQVTVFVFAEAAEALVRDVLAHRQLAVVFSRPSTNRTLQLKGREVEVLPAPPADLALVRRYLALFADDLRTLGWDERYVQAVFWRENGGLLALRFRPEGAFHQTPGPDAGRALPLQQGSGG